MAYKFQLGAFVASGSLVQEGAFEADAAIVDSLDVNSGGITEAGAIAGATSIDGSGDLTMGTITMSGFSVDADGDTAIKSLAIDNSSTIGCDADADIITLAAQSMVLGGDVDFNVAKAGGLQIAGVAVTATAAELNYLDNDSLTAADITKLAALDASAAELDHLDGIGDAAYDAAADSVVFFDATDSKLKYEAANDFTSTLAGDGIKSASGVLALDLNELTAANWDVANDKLAFIDATDNSTKKKGVSNLISEIAGDGLGSSSGVLAVQRSGSIVLASDKLGLSGSIAGDGLGYTGGVNSISILAVNVDDSGIEINSDALRLKDNGVTLAKMAGIARGSIIVGDSSGDPSALALGGAAQFMISDGDDAVYRTMSGDATLAANGALTIANDAVEQAMIADDAVGADQLASNAVVNASVAGNAAILATKINFNTDLGGDITFGNQSNDTISTTGHFTIGGNLTVQGSTTTVDSTTINISSSFTFEGPADAHETILSCATPAADSTLNLPTLSAGTYYIPALADAATDAAAAVTAAEFALLDGGSTVGTSAPASGDGFMHNDAGTMKQTTIDALASVMAGAGLAVSGVTLSVDIDELSALGGTGVAQGDHFIFSDGGTEKKITASNLEDWMFGNVSGDATIAAGGALTVAANAVEGSMLNDNVISGQTALASGLAATDELMVSDAGTLKRMDVSVLSSYLGTNISVDVQNVAASGTLAIGVNYFSDMSDDGEDAVTLPASPTVGQSVKVKAPSDCSAARYITINKAGSQLIDGAASIRLESPFAAVELVYVANDVWRVF